MAEPDGELAGRLCPEVADWFARTYPDFTQAQRLCVPAILEGKSVLLSSPTGSGKTLAGFLGIIDWLVREAPPAGYIYAIYVSPLRALTYDIQKNLTRPLEEMGLEEEIRVGLRTGDTSAKERAAIRRKPPHILLTTPESLAILLCQPAYHAALRTVRFVVVDELHALAENKRGTHLSVSLERLERLKGREPEEESWKAEVGSRKAEGEEGGGVVLRRVGGGLEERIVLGGREALLPEQGRSQAEVGNEGRGEEGVLRRVAPEKREDEGVLRRVALPPAAEGPSPPLHSAQDDRSFAGDGRERSARFTEEGGFRMQVANKAAVTEPAVKVVKRRGSATGEMDLSKFHRGPLCRVGLSATIAPLEMMAGFLVGVGRACLIAEAKMERRAVVEVFSPVRREPYPPAGQSAGRVLQELAALVRSRRSVLIFTNTRTGAEQFGLRLKAALPTLADKVEVHHSSLDRNVRLEVEDRLKNGELRAVVCSTSLEMGVDIGAIDLVVMISAPKGISRTLQRIGRSGHSVSAVSHGILVATNVNDLVECAVTARLARERRLDAVRMPENAADVLAQHLLGLAIEAPGLPVEEAWECVRGAWPYRELGREEFDRVVEYLEGGGRSLEKAYADTFGKLRIVEGRMFVATPRVARDYLVNVGTIASQGLVDVLLRRRRLGTVEENFIKGLKKGDVFVLGGRVVRLVEAGWQVAKVEAADGEQPNVPLWSGGRMALTSGLGVEIGALRTELDRRLGKAEGGRRKAEGAGRRAEGGGRRKAGGEEGRREAQTDAKKGGADGCADGCAEGCAEGCEEGCAEGCRDGCADGMRRREDGGEGRIAGDAEKGVAQRPPSSARRGQSSEGQPGRGKFSQGETGHVGEGGCREAELPEQVRSQAELGNEGSGGVPPDEVQLRRQGRSQVQLGNEEEAGASQTGAFPSRSLGTREGEGRSQVQLGNEEGEGRSQVQLGNEEEAGASQTGAFPSRSLGTREGEGRSQVQLGNEEGEGRSQVQLGNEEEAGASQTGAFPSRSLGTREGEGRSQVQLGNEGKKEAEEKTAGEAVDFLVEDWELSAANAQAVVAHFQLQRRFSLVPRDGMLLIEHHRERSDDRLSHYFFHSLIGRGANDALSRIVAWRVAKLAGGNAMVTVDDYGFLLTLNRFQEMGLEGWRSCFAREGAEEDLRAALKESELVRWQFRAVAQTGLMVPRQLPGKERKLKQLRFSAEILFRVLEQHEPDHPMLAEAYRQALTRFLDVEAAAAYLQQVAAVDWEWRLVETPTVSPFAFTLYASQRKEAMMFEHPEEAVERMYREFYGGKEEAAEGEG